MSTLNNNNYYDIACSESIQQFCKPFMKKLNITNVSYTRFNWDFTFQMINTDKNLLKYFDDNPCKIKHGMLRITNLELVELSNQAKRDEQSAWYQKIYISKFGYYHGIMIFQFKFGYMDCTCFFSDKNNINFIRDIENHYKDVVNFVMAFQSYIKPTLTLLKPQAKKIHLSEISNSGLRFLKECVKINWRLPRAITQLFLPEEYNPLPLNIKNKYKLDDPFDFVELNQKELIILLMLIHGLKFKEIAKELKLSKYTIRDYAIIIRDKFCYDDLKILLQDLHKMQFTQKYLPPVAYEGFNTELFAEYVDSHPNLYQVIDELTNPTQETI